ncbi:MAG: FliM/FliN family flagellar motor switch protein, partial [Chlamydiota bacterium]|nr:FliM/FliN family flagellar motor switch protein [Chlamydiota bacterium]
EENIMSQETDETLNIPKDLSFDLSVELDRITMTLEELSRIKPGDYLPLHQDEMATARLLMNGRPIASGHLILMGENVLFSVDKVSQ